MSRLTPRVRRKRSGSTAVIWFAAGFAATVTYLLAGYPALAKTGPDGDLPAIGRSLFDILTTAPSDDGPRLRVPYPFDALRALIAKAGGLSDGDISETRFPLGRSLQRDAAAPDFFASPRVVLGVTGEPLARDPGKAPGKTMVLKDRLFIGYQPRAEALEIISYNEQAGRFEFLIVEDYAPGKTPRTVQARRALCLSCHHNAAPIFPNPPWSETPANPRIAAKLAKAVGRSPDNPAEITANRLAAARLYRSVEAANRLLHAQKIWAGVCEAPGSARHCKVGLLSTVLEHRLSGRRSHGQGDVRTRRESEEILAAAQRHGWPGGMVIASPFIADRDPLAQNAKAKGAADPLAPRPPIRILDGAAPGGVNRIIDLLGAPLAASDIRWIEDVLRDVGEAVGARRRVAVLPCIFSRMQPGAGGQGLGFACRSGVPGLPTIDGAVAVDPSGGARVTVDTLSIQRLTYKDLAARDLEISGTFETAGAVTLHPADPGSGLRPRTGDGWSITGVVLAWDAAEPPTGTATVTMLGDIMRFRGTVRALAGYGLPGANRAVTDGPLRRRDIMRALAIRLGRPVPDWCCGPDPDLPPATTKAARILAITGLSSEPGPAHPSLQAFHRGCGACHGGAATMPPNFLFGSSERQLDAITGCAPRILARLALWRDGGARALSPMPPSARLRALGTSPAQWLGSSDLTRIRRFAEELSGAANAATPSDYAALPACAPPPAP
jgi:hypothetical protein